MRKILYTSLALISASVLLSCGNTTKERDSDTISAAQMQIQPVESGQYDATYYNITGENERKGSFDGRIMIALSEDNSAVYVYENGNRAKINYTVVLAHPFEKNDSGLYVTEDNKGLEVTLNTDSTYNVLTFNRKDAKVSISFDKTATSTADALTMLERINSQMKKNK